MIVFIGLIIGVLIGMFTNFSIPAQFDAYLSVAIFACLDSVFGALKSVLKKEFRTDVFISGFFGNAILAVALTYLGDKLGMPIYIAAVIVFGGRIFDNFSTIRRILLVKLEENRLH
jgi:small basic protein